MGSEKKYKPTTIAKYLRVADEWLANGENGTKAYQSEYPKASDNTAAANFKKILGITKVSSHIEKKKAAKAKKAKIEHGITFDTQMHQQKKKQELFWELADLALKKKLSKEEKERFGRLKSIISTSDANRIDDIINRMLGFDAPIKVADTNADGNDKETNYANFTTAEIIARANALRTIKENK